MTFHSQVTTEMAITMTSESGICSKNTGWNGTAQASQASALIAAPTTAKRASVGRTRRSRPSSPARKNAEAVGRPQENTTPNSHGSTRRSA